MSISLNHEKSLSEEQIVEVRELLTLADLLQAATPVLRTPKVRSVIGHVIRESVKQARAIDPGCGVY